MWDTLKTLYYKLVIDQPMVALAIAIVSIGCLSLFANQFRLDASADTLVLENDQDLKYYRSIRARYGSDNFLIVTYTPHNDMFDDRTLKDLGLLRDELAALKRVKSVNSILDVPLINSPRVSFTELLKQVRTLESPDTDKELARQEFLTSPLYKNLIMSLDGKTTALQVNFRRDETYQALLSKRNTLREKQLTTKLSATEQQELDAVSQEYKKYSDALTDQGRVEIAHVRSILDKHRNMATIFLGGVPMITADMIDFIDHDIRVFGVGVLCFIILLLSAVFKKPRWVLIPMIICVAAGIGMVGYLGLVEWRVTVVSSNFISLMLIITLSLTVHLIVRYQELHTDKPEADQKWLTQETIRSKAIPSFYTTITTIVAFGSLIVSGIRPVIDFGWMMVVGVGMAFVLAFLIFPAALVLVKPGKPIKRRFDVTEKITRYFSILIKQHTNKTLLVYAFLVVASAIGIASLSVENRFIDYFKDTTEINQGMLVIDRELGGTTPLDVIIDPDEDFYEMLKEFEAEFAEDDFASDTDEASGISGTSYWFNIFQLKLVKEIHDYLDQLPETGKVLSLATTMDLLTLLNDGKELDNISLSIMYKRIPDNIKKSLFDPYMTKDGNQIRFSIRIFESAENLQRDALVKKIYKDIVEKFDLTEQQVHLSGMVVLYNNMLQSLFKSQILTIGVVFLAIMLMFIALFRSLTLSLIAIIPNMVAAGVVLGMMGLLNIPLNIMTITIAAITIGIAVDNSIHYVYRFLEEIKIDEDKWAAIGRCHKSIGRAMYYTSITIALGFSILALSNFIPTIYFGLLTGFAMLFAMVANLTLLPILLVKFSR